MSCIKWALSRQSRPDLTPLFTTVLLNCSCTRHKSPVSLPAAKLMSNWSLWFSVEFQYNRRLRIILPGFKGLFVSVANSYQILWYKVVDHLRKIPYSNTFNVLDSRLPPPPNSMQPTPTHNPHHICLPTYTHTQKRTLMPHLPQGKSMSLSAISLLHQINRNTDIY